MSTQPVFDRGPGDGDLYEQIAVALERDGYIVLPHALDLAAVDGLFLDLKSVDEEEFKRAGIGRQSDFQVNPFVRSDRVRWLDGETPSARVFLDWMEALKLALNRRLFLGLFDYECHYASYPVGAFYKKHVDAFKGRSNRVLSTVFYLNPVWQPGDGGELVIYDPNTDQVLEKVLPEYGKLVIFLSEEFPHEVLAAQRERYSIAGWFRVNASSAALADPAA
ncbi:2OG-Fe(II) oxygenase [Marinimicrobium alkaliphilum]|uniref:2OG-Fe(II) oxygenase n=1 Tax=Marinimicrobium alkaliphilum TaxID=2202654 RepID=UPI000DB956B9|nr:2OG-Fe(II) oxygenase [Marinimicrobium alkaliphilum]